MQPLSQQIQERINACKSKDEKKRRKLTNFLNRGDKIRSLQKFPKEKPFVIEKIHQLYTVEKPSDSFVMFNALKNELR